MLNLVIVSTLVWIAQDQFQRIDLVPHQVSLVMLSAVLALLVAWVAWQARGRWRPAAVGAVVLTIGMQGRPVHLGRYLRGQLVRLRLLVVLGIGVVVPTRDQHFPCPSPFVPDSLGATETARCLTRGLRLMSKTLAFKARFIQHGLAA